MPVNFLKPDTPRKGSPADRGRGRVLAFPIDQSDSGATRTLAQVLAGRTGNRQRLVEPRSFGGSDRDRDWRGLFLFAAVGCGALHSVSVGAVFGDRAHRRGDAQGVLDLVRESYGKPLAMVGAGITIIINLCVVVADMMAVSEAFSIILGVNRLYFVAAIAFSVWYILIFRDYRKITLALVIVSLPLYIYVASAIITGPPIGELIRNMFTPHFGTNSQMIQGIVALFGSFLTPYIVLWQTSSRTDPEHEPHRFDAYAATLVTAMLALSVMIASASVLHLAHPTDMTARQAAEALRPVVGDLGPVLFAIGIIGSGLVAIPVLVASMCYDLAQAMGWRYGLSEHPWEAKSFYLLISAAMLVAGLLNFIHMNPVKALYWSMILAGILTIPIFLFILIISNDRRVMRTTNTRLQNFWVGAATGGAAAATIIYLWMQVFGG